MHKNENLDNMAKRYKEEMMRLYKSNSCDTPMNGGNANMSRPPARPQPSAPPCKFPMPDRLICDTPTPLPAYQPEEKPADMTDNMLNGTGMAKNNNVSDGSVNFDRSFGDPNSRNYSGQQIYVPYADSADTFEGIMLSSAPAMTAVTDNSPQAAQQVFSEQLPDFELPPDIDAERSIPGSIDSRFIIPNSWNILTGDNGWGFLQFEITTGRLGNPVQNATVVVSRIVRGSILLSRVIKSGYNGLTNTIVLPAPRYYCNPFRPCSSRPFAEYRADVYAQNYYPVYNVSIMLYAGVKNVQPIDMIPLPDYGPINPGIQPRSASES